MTLTDRLTLPCTNSSVYAPYTNKRNLTISSHLLWTKIPKPYCHRWSTGSYSRHLSRPSPHQQLLQHEPRTLLLPYSWLSSLPRWDNMLFFKPNSPSTPPQLLNPRFHTSSSQSQWLHPHLRNIHLLHVFVPNKSSQNILLLPLSVKWLLPTSPHSPTNTTIDEHSTFHKHHSSIHLLNMYQTSTPILPTKHHKSLGTRPQLYQFSLPPRTTRLPHNMAPSNSFMK